jgi:hypothetical protein
MYDLRWVNETFIRAGHLDTALVRRLAVLKIWVDNFGLVAITPGGETKWTPGHEGSVFDPERWLRRRGRDEFDIEDLGALAVGDGGGEVSVASRCAEPMRHLRHLAERTS